MFTHLALRSSAFIAIVCFSCGLAPPGNTSAAQAATRVPLVIDELRAERSVAWPITTGVPFPEGQLTDERQCRLVDDRGAERPLQTRIAALWGPDYQSIRWLTIDFIAEPGRTYGLEFGPEIKRKIRPSTTAPGTADELVVDTGPLRAEFVRRAPAALRSLCIDLNGDGRIERSEQVAGEQAAGGSPTGDHVYVDQADRRSTSADDAQRTIVVETAGPVRWCVRVDGRYVDPAGRDIVRYRTRYHFFAGLSLMKVIDEFRVVGSTRDLQFRDIALPLELRLDAASRRVTTAALRQPGETTTIPWQATTQSIAVGQETFRHYGNPDCRAYVAAQTAAGEQRLHDGERAGPWIQAVDDRTAVTASLRWFWQQFPKEWQLTDDRLTLHLWSPRAGLFDFGEAGLREFFGPAGLKYLLDWKGTRTPTTPIENFFFFAGRHALEREGADGLGINKHHEIWYHFAPAKEAAAGREYGDLVERRPLCLASGAWNCSTGVFGPLAARPNDSPHEAAVDRVFDLERYAQDAFGDYGWRLFGAGPHYSYQWDPETQRHYADPRRFEYHTYQRETQLWWCYLRSGERKFYDWAIPAENHWVDIAVAHRPTKFSTEWRGGRPENATLEFPAGDWSIDSPLHYVRHHDTGEAWLRSASQYWGTYHRTLETTTLAYYLTGDERYNDVVEFWRKYWGALAGVRSDSQNVSQHHREQLWFRPTAPGAPTKTWAEMLRDYAPFQSGSRHQMTLFFNLSTLYEHTRDPAVAQVVREYADAFLDPAAPNGVWQCQDHRLPANADSPMLAHYWSPALWKYARATGDPRMPEVLRKYFTACYQANPYAGDVGIYSNVQIAWAWHFTHDPRHLIAAQHELARLQPNAAPLKSPQELGERIYNPHHPIQVLAAVPRLVGALAEAKQRQIAVPAPPPLAPQRALVALRRRSGAALRGVLWGWDESPGLSDAAGKPCGTITATATHRSHLHPFDRTLPGFKVFRHEFDVSPARSDDWCYLAPRLETGILELAGDEPLWVWAGQPVRIDPGQEFLWRRPAGTNESTLELTLESAAPNQLLIDGRPAAGKIVKNAMTIKPDKAEVRIGSGGKSPLWFRIAAADHVSCWVTPAKAVEKDAALAPPPPPPRELLARRASPAVDPAQTFVPGKFGDALLLVPGRELHVPDEIVGDDGAPRRLSDQRQGTIEFWIRKLWDDRIAGGPPVLEVLDNGTLQAPCPVHLPLNEWTHVAVVWRPLKDEPERTLLHVYIDGVDYGNYRSLYWLGYSQPPGFRVRTWLKEFLVRAPPGALFALDDLRISSKPRYLDPTLDFGRQQTFNSFTFTRPDQAATADDATVVLLPLDGDTQTTSIGGKKLETRLVLERRAK